MNFVLAKERWIVLVGGIGTLSMFAVLVAPDPLLRSMFGEGVEGPVADLVARNWGALIGLVGAMLLVSFFHEPSRPLALFAGAFSKSVFVALVLAHGSRFLAHGAGAAVVADAILVVLFLACLAVRRRGSRTGG